MKRVQKVLRCPCQQSCSRTQCPRGDGEKVTTVDVEVVEVAEVVGGLGLEGRKEPSYPPFVS